MALFVPDHGHHPSSESAIPKPRKMLILWLRPLVACLALWTSSTALAEPDTHHYKVTIDSGLSRLSVVAQFSRPIRILSARSRNARQYLSDVRDCTTDQEIDVRNRQLRLPGTGIRCLSYSVDLKRAAAEYRESAILAPGSIVVSPSIWLWRGELDKDTSIRVAFLLPDNVRVSTPWKQLDDSGLLFSFGKSPQSSHAPVVFGDFDYRVLKVPGAVLRISLLKGLEPMDNDMIVDWIRATALNISLAYGRFPNPSPQIVVMPVGAGRANKLSVVPFGNVVRDGGETVELFVDQTRSLEALLGDWTATHEFSHLMLPYISSDHRWISEGFAQYYQNVLLTRAGIYDPLYTWQKLYDGFERGRNSGSGLSPNEAAAGSLRAGLMKIYWSGAALALMADVYLRQRSNGEETLDHLLERFQSCCLPSDRVWSGPEFFQKLDSFASAPVFMPLYRRYANASGFPDVSETLDRLGVVLSDGVVGFESSAELDSIRAAITATTTVGIRK